MGLTGVSRLFSTMATGLALVAVVNCQQAAAAPVQDLRGTVTGGDGERARVSVLRHDMYAGMIEPVAERYTEADGTFAFERVPWFDRWSWGHATVVVVARAS